ncbi:MAG: hypothetical protein CMJ50_04880 [Planctomycetaceae bacterium]|nr:hypothetical protein [Planctomycetaceae bacterium]
MDPIRVRSELAIGGFYCFDEISLYRLAKRLFSGTQIRIDYSISSAVLAATGHLQCLARVHRRDISFKGVQVVSVKAGVYLPST